MSLASVDPYLHRRYARGSYDCLSFARDVWRDATGEDLGERLSGALDPATRRIELRHLRAFERLDQPSDPCLVLMEGWGLEPHIGVFVRGRVLHLQQTQAEYLPLEVAMRGFTRARFYR